ncbi:hypothetical protein ACFRH8_41770, partial [Streptomyces sp. NPDC056707]
ITYLLADDAKVDLLVYARSTSRPGNNNNYRWDGHGSHPMAGPLPLAAAEHTPELIASRALLTTRQTTTTRPGHTDQPHRPAGLYGKGRPTDSTSTPDAGPSNTPNPTNHPHTSTTQPDTTPDPNPNNPDPNLDPETQRKLDSLEKLPPHHFTNLITEATTIARQHGIHLPPVIGHHPTAQTQRNHHHQHLIHIAHAHHHHGPETAHHTAQHITLTTSAADEPKPRTHDILKGTHASPAIPAADAAYATLTPHATSQPGPNPTIETRIGTDDFDADRFERQWSKLPNSDDSAQAPDPAQRPWSLWSGPEKMAYAWQQARGMVGRFQDLPPNLNHVHIAPYGDLSPAERAIRRVAHRLYTHPHDHTGATALAQSLAQGHPAPQPRLLGGARKKIGSTAVAPGLTGAASRLGEAATPFTLTEAEARALAVAGVDHARGAVGAAPGRASSELRSMAIKSVTDILIRHGRDLHQRTGIKPNVALATFLARVQSRERNSLDPGLLALLLRTPDLLSEAAGLTQLAVLVARFSGLADVLASHPALLRELLRRKEDIHDLLQDPKDLTKLLSMPNRREILRDIGENFDMRQNFTQSVAISVHCGSRWSALRGIATSELLGAPFLSMPEFRSAIARTRSAGSAIKALALNGNFGIAAYEYGQSVSSDEWQGLFESQELLRAFTFHPQQIATIFRVSGLLATAVRDPKIVETLSRDPLLAEVLPHSRELAQHLARSPELLQTAFSNPRLGEALSHEPARLNHLLEAPDALAAALRSEAPASEEPRQGGRAGHRVPADPIVTAALRGQPALRTVLDGDRELAATLAAHPGLLTYPHEYRMLLAPELHALRAQVKRGSPLLVPGVLRVVLRDPQLIDAFSAADTAIAPPESPRRRFSQSLDKDAQLRDTIYEDRFFARTIFNATPERVKQFSKIVNLSDLIRRDDRLISFIEVVDASVYGLCRVIPNFLEDLLANDSALLQMAISSPLFTGVLNENPELIGNLLAHPGLLEILSRYENQVTTSAHWRNLFERPSALATLDSDKGRLLAKSLAGQPELLTDALARDSFLAELPTLLDDFAKIRGNTLQLRDAIHGTGGPDITRQGIRVIPEMAELIHSIIHSPGSVKHVLEHIDLTQQRREELAEKARAAVLALEEIPGLRAAADSEIGILVVALEHPRLLAVFRDFPSLIQYFSRTPPSLQVVQGNPSVIDTLLHMPSFRKNFTMTPHVPRAFLGGGLDNIELTPTSVANLQVTMLAKVSKAVRNAVAADPAFHTVLVGNPDLVKQLTTKLTPPAMETRAVGEVDPGAVREDLAQAVMGDLTLLRLMSRRPQLLDVLIEAPSLTAELAARPGLLETPEEYRRLLDNRPLLEAFNTHPATVRAAFTSPQVLRLVIAHPAVATAMARDVHLAPLLQKEARLRELLRRQPAVVNDLIRTPVLVSALRAQPALLEAMLADPSIAARLRAQPELLAAVRARRTLVNDLAGGTPLWRALSMYPGLAEAASGPGNVVGQLRRRPALVSALASGTISVTGQSVAWQAVLVSDELSSRLDARPQLAADLIRHTGLHSLLAKPDFDLAAAVNRLAAQGRLGPLLHGQEVGTLVEALSRVTLQETGGNTSGTPVRPLPTATAASPSTPVPTAAAGWKQASAVPPQGWAGNDVEYPPRLRALAIGHPGIVEALTRNEEVLDLVGQHPSLPETLAHRPELGALIAAQPDIAEELSLYPDRTDT